MYPITLLSTNGMHELTAKICAALNVRGLHCEHHQLNEQTFPDGEAWLQSPVSIRNHDVYLVHDMRWPDVNNALMQFTIAVDMLKRASVERIHAVLPYLPYMRQDRKDKGRVPISAKRIAELIEHNGMVRHVITFDLHADQEEGFFDWAVDHLRGEILLARHFNEMLGERVRDALVVAPDVGASKRAQRFAKRIHNAELAIIDKRRDGPGQNEVVNFIGPQRIDGRVAILFDDMCDSGGTLAKAAELLYARGASKVFAAVSHGLFNNGAEERLCRAGVDTVVLETVPRSAMYKDAQKRITFLPIDGFLADVIYETASPEGSVSKLFA